MKNFKIKDLMISVYPQTEITEGNYFVHVHHVDMCPAPSACVAPTACVAPSSKRMKIEESITGLRELKNQLAEME